MKSAPTTAIILETRTPKKDGLFPVKIRVTFRRQQRYFTLRNIEGNTIALTEAVFSKIRGERPRDQFKYMSLYLSSLETKASDTIKSLKNFTFKGFETRFFSNVSGGSDLFTALKTTADELEKEGRISTSVLYAGALTSLKKFTGKDKLQYEEMDIQLVKDYEKWMLNNGRSLTTVGMYMRNVRAIFRKAQRSGLIANDIYPFGTEEYQIPGGRNIKKALKHEEVGLIASYPTIDGTSEQQYRDYWLFSYLCNGINVKDIARLKYGNINGDVIVFTRAKTQRERKRAPKPITIVITKAIGRIIDRWGNKPGTPVTYIFPILEAGLTPKAEYQRIQQATKQINKYTGEIAKKVGIAQDVTSYTARHSYATVLKRSGAPTEFISESLGHSSVSTTENYLADFELDVKRQWAEKVGKFTS